MAFGRTDGSSGGDSGTPAEPGGAPRRRHRGARWFWLIPTPGLILVLVLAVGLSWQGRAPEDGPRWQLAEGYRPLDVPNELLPYHDRSVVPVTDRGLRDAAGVRMFRWLGKGELLDHPVAQAQYGLDNLNSFRRTGNKLFLDRAIAQAQRNLDRRVESRGGWWYPYDFDLTRCKATPVIDARWYSAMSQGQLLGLFVRLHETTGDEKWRTAAEKTFTTLVLPPVKGQPWGTWQDSNGQVWLEEYPRTRGIRGERVLNGHIFAMYGVYDYWRLTRDPQAGALFGSAAETVRHHVPKTFRSPQWASRYSVDCNKPHLKYHQIHIGQLLMLHRMTGDPVFARYADQLREDYPDPKVDGTVTFAAGTHTGYRFSKTGDITDEKTITLPEGTTATTDERIRITGRGIHYQITSGDLAGWYVPETTSRRMLLGTTVEHTYTPTRTLTIEHGGVHTGYRHRPNGTVTGTRRVLGQGDSAQVSATAWLNGEFSYLLASGPLAGHWLAHRDGLTLS